MGKTSGCKEELPFPGGMVDGEMSVTYFNINIVKKDLKTLCHGFGLTSSGNKPQLQDRLRAFSCDRDKWHMITPAPRRAHRGPRTDQLTKAKPMKKSALRAQELFGSTSVSHVPHLPHQIPTQETPATQARSEAILQWARNIDASSPYLDKEGRRMAGEAQLERAAATRRAASLALPARPSPSMPMLGSAGHLRNFPSQITPSLAGQSPIDAALNPASSNTYAYTFPSLSFTPLHPYILESLVNQSQLAPWPQSSQSSLTTPSFTPDPTTPSSTLSQGVARPTRSITLGNGQVLEFSADDVGPPPAVSFADDLPRLNRMWDDSALGHWDGHSVLKIKGTDIPIKYWRAVYARSKMGVWKPGCWRKVKNQWSEWRSVVKRWRQGSEDDFWHEFSDDSGHRFSYTAIVERIARLQKEDDKKMAAQAREHYGDQFGMVFRYKKGGAIHVKQKDRDIAKQYRRELANGTGDESDMDLDSD